MLMRKIDKSNPSAWVLKMNSFEALREIHSGNITSDENVISLSDLKKEMLIPSSEEIISGDLSNFDDDSMTSSSSSGFLTPRKNKYDLAKKKRYGALKEEMQVNNTVGKKLEEYLSYRMSSLEKSNSSNITKAVEIANDFNDELGLDYIKVIKELRNENYCLCLLAMKKEHRLQFLKSLVQ